MKMIMYVRTISLLIIIVYLYSYISLYYLVVAQFDCIIVLFKLYSKVIIEMKCYTIWLYFFKYL